MFGESARRQAESIHPEHARLRAAAEAAHAAHDHLSRALKDARRRQEDRLIRLTTHNHFDPAAQLASAGRDVTATEGELAAARTRIVELAADPVLLVQPADRLAQERAIWRARRYAEESARRAAAPVASSPRPTYGVPPPEPAVHRAPSPGAGPGIGR